MRFLTILGGICLGLPVLAVPNKERTAILVDKSTNRLLVCDHQDGDYRILKTYHATLGRVLGDKEDESDLKTPEGIYTFKAMLQPPHLAKKFGAMAFSMDFPNTYDRLAGRTGNSIMLHATDEPFRLKRNYDSEGCVVVNNEEITEIRSQIRLGLTPILIFPELTERYLHPQGSPRLREFFHSWIADWTHKRVDAYIDRYHTEFVSNGRNKEQWRGYKTLLNAKYRSIEVMPEDLLIYEHSKYSLVSFTQNYRSRLQGGAWGLRSRGTKLLYIAEEEGKPKIIAENFTHLSW